jgi:hypothetical protein
LSGQASRYRFPVTREPDGVARDRVEVAGLGAWLTGRLGFDPRGPRLAAALTAAVSADVYQAREWHLTEAMEAIAALRETITNRRVRGLPPAGAVDQFTDSTDAAGDPGFLRACVGRADLAERR